MDRSLDPFSPGSGTRPPELAGRGQIIDDSCDDLGRVIAGTTVKSQLIIGLRGVGKTALLRKVQEIAETKRAVVTYIEADPTQDFNESLTLKMQQALTVLTEMSHAKKGLQMCYDALHALARHAQGLKLRMGGLADLSHQPSQQLPIIGHNVHDIVTLFSAIGRAARARNSAWVLMIDELHELQKEELLAVIKGIHEANQTGLPVNAYLAGLHTGAARLYRTKAYTERSFVYNEIDCLDLDATRDAIRIPMERLDVSIDDEAILRIFERTKGYPYLIQEYGSAIWTIAKGSPITRNDAEECESKIIECLDNTIFKVRMSRLSQMETKFATAMASLGSGPYATADIARRLGRSNKSIGPLRSNLIAKGMIHSPQPGELEFTVPMFDEYLRRQSER